MKTTKLVRLAAPAFALALILGACGDDSDDTTDSQVTTTAAEDAMGMDDTTADDGGMTDDGDTTEAEDTTDNGDTGEDGDIVDTAVEAGSFETLVAAIQAAELEETLRGDGPFTVFAPTDDAFDALPDGTLESLLEDPTGDLADILTYHVVEGEVMASDVMEMDGEEVTTVNGATFTVNVSDDSVTLTDAAGNEVTVTDTDVEADNGVIHVLDGVLMPG